MFERERVASLLCLSTENKGGVTNMRQSVFREKNRMLFQCCCHALDFLDVNKIDWNDGEPYVEFSITVNPQSFWDRFRAAYRAWQGYRYVGGTDAVILEQEAAAMLVEFLQSPYEEEEGNGEERA